MGDGFSISGGIDLVLGIFGGGLLVWGLFAGGGWLATVVGVLLIAIGVWVAVNKR